MADIKFNVTFIFSQALINAAMKILTRTRTTTEGLPVEEQREDSDPIEDHQESAVLVEVLQVAKVRADQNPEDLNLETSHPEVADPEDQENPDQKN